MKQIVAFVRPSHAGRVVHALESAGLYHLSFCRIHEVVHPDGPIVRAQMGSDGSTEVRVEAYCEQDRVEHTVALIRELGRVGDLLAGAVFVHSVDEAWSIGSGHHTEQS